MRSSALITLAASMLVSFVGCGPVKDESQAMHESPNNQAGQDITVNRSMTVVEAVVEKSYPRGTNSVVTVTDEGKIAALLALLPDLQGNRMGEEGLSWKPIGRIVFLRKDESKVQVEYGDFAYTIVGSHRGSLPLPEDFIRFIDDLIKGMASHDTDQRDNNGI
jgi:hypothetical protein